MYYLRKLGDPLYNPLAYHLEKLRPRVGVSGPGSPSPYLPPVLGSLWGTAGPDGAWREWTRVHAPCTPTPTPPRVSPSHWGSLVDPENQTSGPWPP